MEKNRDGQVEIKKLCAEIYRTMKEGKPRPTFDKIEDKLSWLILEQRYENLKKFIEKQNEKFGEYGGVDSEELLELWFLHNNLKEIQFIGPDMYADAIFVKHKVPYLYRCVGFDGDADTLLLKEGVAAEEMGERIFEKCRKQIIEGRTLFSYSKCFGKMLYKYANIRTFSHGTVTIEIRKDAYVNAVSEDGYHSVKSLQKYIWETKEYSGGTKIKIPFFAVDMSNARMNDPKNLKRWLDGFLGIKDDGTFIYTPVGDAQVVCDFTNIQNNDGSNVLCDGGVERFELSKDELCVLLYLYFSKFAEKYCDRDCSEQGSNRFECYIQKSIKTMRDVENGKLQEFYESILKHSECPIPDVDDCKLQRIMDKVVWNREIFFMTREKEEKDEKKKIADMEIYGRDNLDTDSQITIWKDILFGAVRGRWYDYSK